MKGPCLSLSCSKGLDLETGRQKFREEYVMSGLNRKNIEDIVSSVAG